MTKKLSITIFGAIGVFIVGILIAVALGLQFPSGMGYVSLEESSSKDTYRNYTFFASSSAQLYYNDVDNDHIAYATTTSATSTNINPWYNASTTPYTYVDGAMDIRGAKKVTMYFQRGDICGLGNAGSSRFRVEVTPNGTDWYRFKKLVPNRATTSVTSVEIVNIAAGTTTAIHSLDMEFHAFKAIRCIVDEVTDGEHSCRATAEY